MKSGKGNNPRNCFAVFDGGFRGSFPSRAAKAFDSFRSEASQRVADGEKPVWLRIFLSDIINQMPLIREEVNNISASCAVSIIEQPPVNGSKIAVMACFLEGAAAERTGGDSWTVSYRGERYIFQSLRFKACGTSGADGCAQTMEAFERHKRLIAPLGMTIKDNTLRTWLYCRDIDRTYGGVVRGRNDFFAQNGLTADTHFIASTGIEGYTSECSSVVGVDFFSRIGGGNGDVKYLQALDHLNPTAQYGVAFERGTSFAAGGSRVALISGTASIDRFGNCINLDNPARQTERLIENIGALLADDGLSEGDIRMLIVYLRDAADRDEVESVVNSRLPGVAAVFTHAKVCRPAWLVEAECIAVK